MNQEFGFETIPFEIAPEFQGEMFEEENETRRRRSFAGGASRRTRPRSRPSPRPRPIRRGLRGPRSFAVIEEPYGLDSRPSPGEPPPPDSERTRWVQDCLNQALGLQIPVTGVMGAETRSAVRAFQKQQGLRASGIVGPDTEEALKAACNGKTTSAGDNGEVAQTEEVTWGEAEFSGVGTVSGEINLESPFSETEELELASELLSVSNEEELDQFLGKLVKGAWKGLKKVGKFVGKIAKPLGGVLKGVAKAALPFVGGALGSFIPIPGVGTALGSALGGALSSALELEFGEINQEEQEFEMARRFVRLAGTAARQAALDLPDNAGRKDLEKVVLNTARQHLPMLSSFQLDGNSDKRIGQRVGAWTRRRNRIIVFGA